MKKKLYVIPTLLTAITFITFIVSASCSKDKDADEDLASGNGGITMKVDGEQWKSTTTTLVTKEVESDVSGKYHAVLLSGLWGSDNGQSETLTVYVNIPANKFENPKGTYPVAIDEEETAHFWALFSSVMGTESSQYVTADPDNSTRTVGSLEITGFEIGDQRLPGQSTSEEGYTKLSGNFHFEMYSALGEDNTKLKITEGKFNLSAGFDFD